MRLFLAFLTCFTLFGLLPATAAETYDLIFKTGTLSELPSDGSLVYQRDVNIREQKETSDHNTGTVKLTFAPEDMARLNFVRDGKSRRIGDFPATVGNPIIMYFVETVIRDVSQNAGGSPFYIRNRIKASLLQKVPIEDAKLTFNGKELPVKQITLRPFLNDKNRSKMQGYEDLALTITMSDQVPGWYYSLVADTQPSQGKGPVYTSTLKLSPEGQNQ